MDDIGRKSTYWAFLIARNRQLKHVDILLCIHFWICWSPVLNKFIRNAIHVSDGYFANIRPTMGMHDYLSADDVILRVWVKSFWNVTSGSDVVGCHVLEGLKTLNLAWWRHQMETFSALLALCAGNSPIPANSPHKGQWRGALMFSLICARIKHWVNNREAGDLRRHRGHYDVNVMSSHHLGTL